jgi:aspartate racemase
MGIDVTSALLDRIIDRTHATREQDHLPLIINHNPQIPDRTEAILGTGEDPMPHLLASLEALVRAGAEFVAIPCNTAHHYYDAMQAAVAVPIIHMLRATAARCLETTKGLQRVGLLATTGTVKSRLYQGCFAEHGVEVLTPPEKLQTLVMGDIMAIKARQPLETIRADFASLARRLADDGAQAVIVGCTDISLAMSGEDSPVPVVDSLSVLADAVVRMAREEEQDGRR